MYAWRVALAVGTMLALSLNSWGSEYMCPTSISGYKIVENSMFAFKGSGSGECFFAFYTTNPDKSADTKGCGNFGDAIWFALVMPDGTVRQLKKPADLDSSDWQIMNGVAAVPSADVNANGQRDITDIAENRDCARTFRRPFVFIQKGHNYSLDTNATTAFYGHNLVSVPDVKIFYKTGALPKDDDLGPDPE